MRVPKGFERRGKTGRLVRWSVRLPDGTRKQESEVIHGDDALAMAKWLEKTLPKPNPEPVGPPQRTFKSYREGEWARYEDKHWKGSTKITQGSFVNRHITFFDPMLMNEIKAGTIELFHATLLEKGLGDKTVENIVGIFNTMLSYATDLEIIPRNPMTRELKHRLFPHKDKPEKPALTGEQVGQVLAALPIRTRAFYVMLACTSVRSGEALGLKWEDVEWGTPAKPGVLHIRRRILRGEEDEPKTRKSKRDRPMLARLQSALLNHRALSVYTKPTDYVFCSSTGRPANPDQLRECLQATLKQLGITFERKRADGLHLLRHSSGSIAYDRTGGNVKATQEWLGHSNSKVTMDVYVHTKKNADEETARLVEQAIFQQAIFQQVPQQALDQVPGLIGSVFDQVQAKHS